MKPPKLPMEGACRCGHTRIRITAAPLVTSACHCTGCQKMTGSAYSLSAMFPAEGFEVTEGAPVIGGLRGPDQRHHFCPDCMSWMFTTFPAMEAVVNLRATMLDDVSWFEPFVETMTDERLPWVRTPARHGFEGFPPIERFESLMAEFAQAQQGA
ncbi:GFA family protein [Limimaricola pyoseonensis]|uniref:Uncharacterized conserved protein n=1 Tax=Limimaricola pyoseonensis TaxID=521013 RepID=A0A1G7CJI9_9RHOB|nr:GFA family protein [Limimaricola pyoseonensis]SDE39512.1 Uncharacterized conserved protein [Limimaricola pyoseonensis]